MAVTMSIKKAPTKLALKQPRNFCEKLLNNKLSYSVREQGKREPQPHPVIPPSSPTNTESFSAKTIAPSGLVAGVNSDFICKYN